MLNETIIMGIETLVKTATSCYTEGNNIWIYIFAVIGVISVGSSLLKLIFGSILNSLGITIGFVIWIIELIIMVIKKVKKR